MGAAAVLWGLWPVWARGAAAPLSTAAMAFLIGGILGLPLAIRERRTASSDRLPMRRRDFLSVIGLGAASGVNLWLYLEALAHGAVAPGVLSHYLAPIFVALTAPLVLREAPSWRVGGAAVIALAGTALVVGPGGVSGATEAEVHRAAGLGAASAVFYAITVLISKPLTGRLGNAELLSYLGIVAGLLLLPVGGLPPDRAWPYVLAASVCSTLVPGVLFYAGLRRTSAARASVLTYVEVFAAVVIAWIAWGEWPGPLAFIGGGLIVLAGIIVVSRG